MILNLYLLFVLIMVWIELRYQMALAEIYKDAYEQAQSDHMKLFDDKE